MNIPKINNEIIDSVSESWKEKVNTPIYGVFSIWWAVFHWKLLITIFLVSEDRIWEASHLLKGDYLSKAFFDIHDWYFWVSWVLPFILTYLVIWILPKWVLIPAFKKDEQDKVEKKRIRIQEQQKLSEAEKKFEETETKKLSAVEEKVKKEKAIKNIDPTINWEKEYISFRNSKYYSDFNVVIESVYERNGLVSWKDSNYQYHGIPKGILAYSHANGLVEFSSENRMIDLTEKGKFFVKQFSADNNIR